MQTCGRKLQTPPSTETYSWLVYKFIKLDLITLFEWLGRVFFVRFFVQFLKRCFANAQHDRVAERFSNDEILDLMAINQANYPIDKAS